MHNRRWCRHGGAPRGGVATESIRRARAAQGRLVQVKRARRSSQGTLTEGSTVATLKYDGAGRGSAKGFDNVRVCWVGAKRAADADKVGLSKTVVHVVMVGLLALLVCVALARRVKAGVAG